MKGKYKKKSGARKGLKRYAKKKAMPSLVGYIKGAKLGFPFPSMLAARLRTSVLNSVNLSLGTVGGNNADFFFKLNGLVNQGPFANYPLGTLTGSGTNVASGLYNLLSSDAITGNSVAPYGRYLVRASSIAVQYCSVGTLNQPITMVIVPISTSQSATTISTAHLKEQPYAKSYLYPQVLNEEAKRQKHAISVKSLFGLTSLDTTDDAYGGIGIADPPALGSWQIRIGNADGASTTTITGVLNVEIVYDCIFFDRNSISSTIPS